MQSDYKDLLTFATARQREVVKALQTHGSSKAAASALGIAPSRVRGAMTELRKEAARRGFAPQAALTRPAADGFHVAKVSTKYDADGNVAQQWVQQKPDAANKWQSLVDAVADIAEPFKGAAKPVKAPKHCTDDLLCVYPMGDPHLGMYAWHEETGEDFDLEIAERDLCAAVDALVALAPPSKEALIVNLGDFFHSDNSSNQTARSGNALDVDTRWSRVLSVGIRTMRRCIDRALTKHETVRVICEIGNHDDHSAIMLALCLANYYEKEPRVIVDTSPAKFHWHRFGENLIGITHGDTVKMKDLGEIMSCDRKVDWGSTSYRYWYTGHIHHDRAVELRGCTVESFRTLAARDAWHTASGYRSDRDMKVDVIHRQFGKIGRHIVGINMIRAGL